MRILMLAGAASIHTIRWANGLKAAGHEVHVITQHPALEPFDDGVIVHEFAYRGVLGYFSIVPAVRKILRRIQPDIVNAHYASGYATTARLVGFSPWVLSVWGSDVYEFPYKSPLHKWLVRKNIAAADVVASTSHCMAEQTRTLLPELNDIAITPFGVDMAAYASPAEVRTADQLVIGTVKTMAHKYGIDTLIEAFALVLQALKQEAPDLAAVAKLRLVGGGPQSEELKNLAQKLGVSRQVEFAGRVPHQQVPTELDSLDIYVALSRIESFGVAIIEAGAAGKPVVVSDAGGLPEVTIQGKTGLIVPMDNPQAAADAILELVRQPELRIRMGLEGKEHVRKSYSWDACVDKMISVYHKAIDSQRP